MDFMSVDDRRRQREEVVGGGDEGQHLEPPKQKAKLQHQQQQQQPQQQQQQQTTQEDMKDETNKQGTTTTTKSETMGGAAGALTANNDPRLSFLDHHHHHHAQHHHHSQQQQQQLDQSQSPSQQHDSMGSSSSSSDKLSSVLKLQIYVFQYKLQKEVNCVSSYDYHFDNVDKLKEFIKEKCIELQPSITLDRMNQYVEIRDTSKKTKMNIDGITQAVVKKFRKKHQTMKVHIYKNGKTYTRKEYMEELRMTDDKPESALNIQEKVIELKKRHPQLATRYGSDDDIWKAWALEILLARHDIERQYYVDHMPAAIVQLCKSHDIIQHLLAHQGGEPVEGVSVDSTAHLGVSKMMNDIQNANSDLCIAIESTLKKHTHHVTQALTNIKPTTRSNPTDLNA